VARALGLVDVAADVVAYEGTLEVTAALVERWCSPGAEYRGVIEARAGGEAAAAVCRVLGTVVGERRAWPISVLHFTGRAESKQ
jgi:hypothetical protein